MNEVWASMNDGSTHKKRSENIRKLLESRSGEYLIKSTDKYLCLAGIGYVHCTSRGNGWIGKGTRKEAAWFTKEEIKEIQLSGLYKFVKR